MLVGAGVDRKGGGDGVAGMGKKVGVAERGKNVGEAPGAGVGVWVVELPTAIPHTRTMARVRTQSAKSDLLFDDTSIAWRFHIAKI